MPTKDFHRQFTEPFRRRPDVALFLLGALFTVLILPSSPLKMVSDSFRRFRSAAWIWNGQSPGGWLPGVDGIGHHWDGVGQSLVFVPFDMTVAALGVQDVATRFSIVAWLLFPMINGLVLLLSWHALRQLGFRSRVSSLGTLITLGCTTLMFHFQNNQENPLMLAYALTTVVGILKWNDSGSLLWLNLACAAQAGSISIRVTNLAYVLPLFGLPLMARLFDRSRHLDLPHEARQLARITTVALPWCLAAFAADRWWNWVRFGTLKGTYYSVFQQWALANFNDLPPGFPFSVPFSEGFQGMLFSPAKGVVFYEPLVAISVVFWILYRTETTPRTKAMVFIGCVALLGTAVGLARLYYWDSEPNWGPRYLATPAHLLELPLGAWIASQLTRGSIMTRILGGFAGCLLLMQTSGIWWAAYHENVSRIARKGPERVRLTSEYYSRGLPLQEPDGNTDWRFIDRPIGVAADLRRQLLLSGDEWSAGNPPLRMIWVTGQLKSLSPSIRWGIRVGWLAGVIGVISLARLSLQGEGRRSSPEAKRSVGS